MFARKLHTSDLQDEYISQMKVFLLFVCPVLFCLVLLFGFIFIDLSQDIIASIHSNINVWDLIKETGRSALQGLIQRKQAELSEHPCVRQLSASSRDSYLKVNCQEPFIVIRMFAEKSATLNLHSILLLLDGVNGS